MQDVGQLVELAIVTGLLEMLLVSGTGVARVAAEVPYSAALPCAKVSARVVVTEDMVVTTGMERAKAMDVMTMRKSEMAKARALDGTTIQKEREAEVAGRPRC